jgi:NAD(P)-dependent dehydrogenase (short-subunit alcohol dehydrogenase family)
MSADRPPLRRQHNGPEDHQTLLKKKVGVIYDADGAIGRAVAKTFAREGAPRSIGPVGGSNQSASSRTPISSNGVAAHAPQVDVLDETAAEAQSCQSTTSCR